MAPAAARHCWRLEAFERANLALSAAVRDVPQRWNDALDRTREQVLDALLRATGLISAPRETLLAEDLLDDLERYRAIPDSLFEHPA